MQGANAHRTGRAGESTRRDLTPGGRQPLLGRPAGADVGELIAGRYRLVDRIAVGGMGVVWEGWDELLARRVAVKQVLTQPGLSEADALLARNRVIREARITARLHHPRAVTIYDVVNDGDYPCLIMQFVPSSSLNGLLRERGTLPQAHVGRIGADLAAALQAAHAVGIVHRDVKPGNVLVTEDGSARLTDFGISHAVGDVTLTSTGMVSGTPAYLAPEVARGGTSGFAADVFSLGATLYTCLEGTPPFGMDPNPMAVLHRVASGQITPPQRSGQLTPLLLGMMAPEPADRPTMSEVSHTLTLPAISPQSPPPARHPAEPPARHPAEPPARLPAVSPARTHRPKWRRPAVIAVLCVIALTALAVVSLLVGSGDGGRGGVAATPTQVSSVTSPVLDSPSSGADPAPTVTAEAEPAGSQTTAVDPAAAELAAAVSDYYALMPGNTDAGWARLTPSFQSGMARDREYYNSFWAGVQRVSVTDVTYTAPDGAEATVTYSFADGSVSVERTAYRLVRDGAVLKIDSSSVVSSRSG